jgi:hypothetical protein
MEEDKCIEIGGIWQVRHVELTLPIPHDAEERSEAAGCQTAARGGIVDASSRTIQTTKKGRAETSLQSIEHVICSSVILKIGQANQERVWLS